MKLENMLVSEKTSIKEVMERLEKFRCKNIYVVQDLKLLASISDGDIRRFILKNGNVEGSVNSIANYKPIAFYENQVKETIEVFARSDVQSIPILNLNDEITSVLFRNDVIIKKENLLNLPIVIMAGGKGTRLYPYTKILPKALIPIGDIPISEHIVNRFHLLGCNNFYMILNHMGNMIKSYFDNVDKTYSINFIDEDIPLGTGGGLSLLKGKIKGDFILTNCDILVDADFTKIYQYHKEKNNFITIIAAEKTIKIPYGILKIDQNNEYKGALEKPENNYIINTGVYIINAQAIQDMEDNVAIGFPDLIEENYKSGNKIGVYTVKQNAFMDMGQLDELEEMKKKVIH